MTYKRALSIVFFVFVHVLAIGQQIRVEFPVERIVFQRNNADQGNVNIYGTVAQDCDRVEARLVARNTGQGTTTSWMVIDSKVDGQSFVGKIQNKSGWYRLEVRGVKNETVLFTSSVERVGIGEVFLIAGQSNAQGYGPSPNAKGANDDRVNTYVPRYHDTHGTDQYNNLPGYLNDLSFAKLEAHRGIGPTGYTPYCYGELGDMLVSRLNVPVLFFNAAFTGTSTNNWVQSAKGIRTYNEQYRTELQDGAPYRAFKVTLQSINTLTGFRSVLWHQGEHDRFTNGDAGISAPEYANNLRFLINQSRSDIGQQIPWMVSLASYLDLPDSRPKVDQRVIDGQRMVINTSQGIWQGPATDNIQVPRYDGAHFQNVQGGTMGLTQLASAWNGALTDAFFSGSNPVLPKDALKINHYCIGNGTVMIGPGNNYNEYYWSNGSRGKEIISSSGTYQLVTRDATGNIYRSNSINIGNVFLKTVPVPSFPDGTVGCEGKSLRLVVPESKYSVQWNTGAVGNTLNVSNSGGYSAQFRSEQNCYSSSSQQYNVSFKAPPAKPNLMFVNGGGYKCDGETITVAIANVQGADIKWSTGATTNQISLKDNSHEFVTATLYSLPNCPSPVSNPVTYRFYENPPKPVIGHDGPFYLKVEAADSGDRFDWSLAGTSVSGETGNFLHIQETGSYQVRSSRNYIIPGGILSCISPLSDAFSVTENAELSGFSIYPNPVSRGLLKVTSDGERENVDLLVIDQLGREVYKTHFDRISYPQILDLTSRNFQGKYFVLLRYEAQSKAFPIVFVK